MFWIMLETTNRLKWTAFKYLIVIKLAASFCIHVVEQKRILLYWANVINIHCVCSIRTNALKLYSAMASVYGNRYLLLSLESRIELDRTQLRQSGGAKRSRETVMF